MSTRTVKSTVTFHNPFVLGGMDETLPAGTYAIETDEQLIEGVTFTAYRRVSSIIFLPAMSVSPNVRRVVTVVPGEIDAALERDALADEEQRAAVDQ